MSSNYETYWLSLGTMLEGRYRIDDVIEEGGMGIVYLGFDTVLNIPVSIKEYFPRRHAMRGLDETEIHIYKGKSEEQYKSGLDKFAKEAKMLAQFQGIENIVLVTDFLYENRTAYIIMEHVEGTNAKKYVEENGRIPPAKLLSMMEPILRSLEVIHRKGLLHRDISPDNIIIDNEGKAVLVDFGATRISDSEETRTMTVFFKRGYSAEEQYALRSRKGAYTDIYALCATMYFMLTGIRPEESVRRLIQDSVKPLTRFRDIPMEESAKEAIMKGMAVEIRDRYHSVKELYQDLYLRETDTARPGRRHRVFAMTAFIAVMLSGTVAYSAFHDRARETAVRETEGFSTAESGANAAASGASQSGESPAAAETAPVTYEIPSVKGLTKEKAIRRLQKNGDDSLQIRTKRKYSTKMAKGRVLAQSVTAGTIYNPGAISHIVLTVSRGRKKTAPKQTREPVHTTTPRPVPTKKPAVSNNSAAKDKKPKDQSKKNKGEDFAGALPW